MGFSNARIHLWYWGTLTFAGTFELSQADQIFTTGSPPSLSSSVSVHEDRIREAVENYDVIIFDQGLQYMNGPTGLTSHHFRCIGELLQEVTSDENKKV